MYKPNKLTAGHNLRWESSRMMLPEHVTMLNQLDFEKKKKPKPLIDEQQWEEFASTINEAKAYNMKIKITVWDAGFFKDVEGWVHGVDPQLKRIRIDIDKIDVDYIQFEDITGVEFAD